MADQNITLQVHPGCGFLLENKSFVEELDKRGVAFIWPNTHTIHVMGDKIESKWTAMEAGINTIPCYDGLPRSVHLDLIEDATQPHNW